MSTLAELERKIRLLQKAVEGRPVVETYTPTLADERQRELLDEIWADPRRDELPQEFKDILTLLRLQIP